MKKPTINELDKGIRRFHAGERPWPERVVDWYFVSKDGRLYPLKYTYALSIGARPATFTTNQAKAAMRHLGLGYVSMKENADRSEAFEAAVRKAIKNKTARRKRLQQASKVPNKYAVVQQVFSRNPDVVAEVLDRAQGKCEFCGHEAPFNRRSDGMPTLKFTTRSNWPMVARTHRATQSRFARIVIGRRIMANYHFKCDGVPFRRVPWQGTAQADHYVSSGVEK